MYAVLRDIPLSYCMKKHFNLRFRKSNGNAATDNKYRLTPSFERFFPAQKTVFNVSPKIALEKQKKSVKGKIRWMAQGQFDEKCLSSSFYKIFNNTDFDESELSLRHC